MLFKRKYQKSFSSFILFAYTAFLIAATFHTHHIHFYSYDSVNNTDGIPSAEIASVCIFNQINRPTYFYCNQDSFTLEVVKVFVIAPTNFDHENVFRPVLHSAGLRAPPEFA